MEQTWRVRLGIPGFRSRRSEEETLAKATCSRAGTVDADDFSDVFGGPPRTVLFRQFSDSFEGKDSTSFYEEVFRSTEVVSRPRKGGRSLPAFRIPVKEGWFYRNVFRSDDGRRSRDRSEPSSKEFTTANSPSDYSPLRPIIVDDVAFPSSSSNLSGPSNVPTQWNSYRTMFKEQEMPQFPHDLSAHIDNPYAEDEYNDSYRSSDHGLGGHVSSPETVILAPNSFRGIKICVDDLELNSPSSADSSLCEDSVYYGGIFGNVLPEDDDDDDEDAMSSYVIEITSINREEEYREEVSIDDAIAWAKSKYQSPASETDLSARQQESEQSVEEEGRPVVFEFADQQLSGDGLLQTEETQQRDIKVEEGKPKVDIDRELEGLDEKIKLWSAGKETNIRLLLSTLHYILWSSSGWSPISLTNLIGGSQVKKAYQKARLCLHPDKLQQRGATMLQKYVAEKAFAILQDAWAVYISQDVFLS